MLDAWVSCTPDKAVPHTGSLRGDLLALFSHVEAGLTTGMMQRIFPQMIAAAKVNPGVADAYRSFIAQRRRPLRTVLERAVDNGELPSTTNVEMVQDLLVAPVLFRWLVSDAEAGAEFVAGVIDLVLTGAGARETVG